MRAFMALLVGLTFAAETARADEIPTVTLTDVGPNQDIPAGRTFYLAGTAEREVHAAQAVLVRTGSSRLFGDRGADCNTVMRQLRIDGSAHSAADDGDDSDPGDPDAPLEIPILRVGVHRAFELFDRADLPIRDAAILVSAPWRRTDDNERQYRVLVPSDSAFFAAGHGYCLFVVTTDHKQDVEEAILDDLIDALGKKLVECDDKASCDDEALDDYETRLARVLTRVRGPVNGGKLLAARLKETARVELGSATGLIEARDRLDDRWKPNTQVLQSIEPSLWLDVGADPFAFAVTSLLARSAALLPQVRPNGVALFTNDGKLQVGAIQILDDGRSIRVAASRAPGDKARVLTATTDALEIADGLVLYDLIQLGYGRVRIDKEWVTLDAVGQRVAALGLDEWTPEDAAFLGSALAQLRRLELYSEHLSEATCKTGPIGNAEAEHTPASTNRHLGEWMACKHIDLKALESLTQLLNDLVTEDQAWKVARDKLVLASRKIVTVTSTAPLPLRVSFETTTWVFSYITPVLGAADVIRTDESFGLFYVGAQLHLAPNPVDDVQWSHGVTAKDLRRAVALEIGVAPTSGSFGPDHRFSGPGRLPPLFFGIALHVIPYTSFTFGAALVDRKRSTLAEEEPHTVISPYVGFTIQLNLPDLIRQAVHPGSSTRATIQ